MNAHHITRDFVTLWVTIDPIGTVPLFVSLTAGLSERDRRGVAVRATLISLGLLLAAVPLMRLLGKSGANVLTRVMGLLLASLAANMAYTAFPQLGT